MELEQVKDKFNSKANEIRETIADAQKHETQITKEYATKIFKEVKLWASAASSDLQITARLHQLTDPSLLRDDEMETVLVNVAKFLENEVANFKPEHVEADFVLPKK